MLTQEMRYSYGVNGFGNWFGTATFRNMPTDAERVKARRVIRAHILAELAEREGADFSPSSVRLRASGAGPFMGGWSLTWTEREEVAPCGLCEAGEPSIHNCGNA